MSCSRAARRAVFGLAPTAEQLGELGIEALHVGLEDRLLPELGDVGLQLGLGLVVGLLDARRVDAPVLQELLERHARNLAPDAVERAEDHRVGGVVDDEVDAGEILQRADVAALAADDAALHVVARELDDGDRGLGRMAGGETLHGHGEDRAHAALRVALGLLLDRAQDLDRVVARLVLDVLQERLLGLPGAEACGALEGPGVVLAQLGEVLLLARETGHVGLEVALALVELGLPAVQRGLQLPGSFGLGSVGLLVDLCRGLTAAEVDGPGGRLPAVGRGEPATPIEASGRDEAERQDGRRDHEFHFRVLSPRAGMAPGPGGLPCSWSGRPAARAAGTDGFGYAAERGRASGALVVCGSRL
jgi:hypothetical protein